jgi:hypothetical protein
MQDNVMHIQAQPFVKLAQANMDLLTQFTTSPEVTSQATANAGQLFQQASESAMKLMQSGAFTHLMQGMLKNYTEFLIEVSQSWMVTMRQGHDSFAQQAQEVAEGVVDVAEVRGRRARQAA